MPITPFFPPRGALGDTETTNVPYHYLEPEEQAAIRKDWETDIENRKNTPGASISDHIATLLHGLGALRDPALAGVLEKRGYDFNPAGTKNARRDAAIAQALRDEAKGYPEPEWSPYQAGGIRSERFYRTAVPKDMNKMRMEDAERLKLLAPYLKGSGSLSEFYKKK